MVIPLSLFPQLLGNGPMTGGHVGHVELDESIAQPVVCRGMPGLLLDGLGKIGKRRLLIALLVAQTAPIVKGLEIQRA